MVPSISTAFSCVVWSRPRLPTKQEQWRNFLSCLKEKDDRFHLWFPLKVLHHPESSLKGGNAQATAGPSMIRNLCRAHESCRHTLPHCCRITALSLESTGCTSITLAVSTKPGSQQHTPMGLQITVSVCSWLTTN